LLPKLLLESESWGCVWKSPMVCNFPPLAQLGAATNQGMS